MNLIRAMLGVIFLFSLAQCSRILLLPVPHHSSVNIFSIVAKTLQDYGHEVYVLTLEVHQHIPEGLGVQPLVHEAETKEDRDIMAKLNPTIVQVLQGEATMLQLFGKIFPLASNICRDINKNERLMNKVRDLNFDLAVVDGIFHFSCIYIIPYRFGLKYLTITFMHDPWTFGLNSIPSTEPAQLLSLTPPITLLQRTKNTIPFLITYINPFSWIYSKDFMNEFTPDRPYKSLRQLMSESELIFVNTENVCLGFPRLSAPHYKFVGGLTARPPQELPRDLKLFADTATEGLIVLSLGSVKALHITWPSTGGKVVKALERLPEFKAIIQYNPHGVDKMNSTSDNVKLVKWLPQNDLLAHPNTKLFITHGGNNGQQEAVFHGVPLLTIPFGGDQIFNGLQAQKRGYGITLDRTTLTIDGLHETIIQIINNASYAQNVRKCSAIIKSMPSPREKILFWVNHVLEFGGDHLKAPGLDMSLFQIINLDVLALISFLSILFFQIMFMVCHKMCVCCRCKKIKQD